MELVTKDSIRQGIWDYLEASDLAAFPRPVHHRIPNFKGAAAACDRLTSMEIFQRARTIKVNPDKPQQQARFLTLEANKMLLVPTPRLRSGLFNKITPPLGANKNMLRTCSSSQGVRQYSSPVGLDAEVKVDLIIIGCAAVSPKGYRIGKGEGYADMEFAMMSSMGAVNDDTVVVTTVHDCQVLDDIPEHLFGEHDLGVDYILTPTRTIRCDNQRPRPKGIIWHLLTRDKFSQIPILKILRRQEAERGTDVRLKEEISVDSSPVFCRTLESKTCLRNKVVDTRMSSQTSTGTERSEKRGDVASPVSRLGLSQISGRSSTLRNDGKNVGIKAVKKARNPESSPEMTGEKSEKYSGAGQNHDRTMNADVTQEFTQVEARSEKMFEGHSGKGQSASVGASRGRRPASSRRRDLDGMFAWSTQGK